MADITVTLTDEELAALEEERGEPAIQVIQKTVSQMGARALSVQKAKKTGSISDRYFNLSKAQQAQIDAILGPEAVEEIKAEK